MKIRILKVAQLEFNESKAYYEIEQAGLGHKFEAEIKNALKKILQFPNAWPIERSGIRRFVSHRFPYKILYSIENDEILIIAFAHLHRRPGYWKDRTKEIN